MENLPAMEERHRTAQCHDTLNTIRNTLRLKTHMVYFKNINSRGQKDGLRSRSMIDRVQGKVGTAARKYREGRAAKLLLCGPGAWEEELRLLRDEDLRSYADPDAEANKLKAKKGVVILDGEADVAEEVVEVVGSAAQKRRPAGESRRILSWIWQTIRTGASVSGQPRVLGGDHLDDSEFKIFC